MSQEFAKVVWRPADVEVLRPNWTDARINQWLREHESQIQDRLLELGWQVLEDLLSKCNEEDF